jgi:hypothetical protein
MDNPALAQNPFLDTLSKRVVHGAPRAANRAATAPAQSVRVVVRRARVRRIGGNALRPQM